MDKQRTFCLFLSYVGTFFRGSQYQLPPLKTVQHTIQNALESVLQVERKVPVRLASRTDAGVHAVVNVASFSLFMKTRVTRSLVTSLHQQLNQYLLQSSECLRVTDIKLVSEDAKAFDCRRSVTEKCYVYRLGVVPSHVGMLEYINKMDAFEAGMIGLTKFSRSIHILCQPTNT
ncbi:PUSL1 [Bugula neritina]|uniref:PUSL1 n=1 Tax=Bugula neritina TaxID=10212 RepID=A0A7J7KU37_BUGNE|nr:PUSL1 [Bugula neritina]